MASPTDGNRDRGAAASVPPPPLQFGLRTIFLITAIVAAISAGAAARGWAGVFLALFAMCAALLFFERKHFGCLGAWGCVLSMLMVGLLWPVDDGRTPSLRSMCRNNMKQVWFSLSDYEQKKRRFPPVAICDSSGKPLHSWRLLMLPQLDEYRLYNQYDFSQPWNSVRNSKVVQTQLPILQCPRDAELRPNETSYVAVIAPGSIWSVSGGAKLADIKDDPHDTILLVEMHNSGIAWAEPRDLDLSNLPPGITKQNLLHSLSNHAGGFNAVFADGHVEFIREDIPWAVFEAMLTIAGGEKVDRDKW